MPPDQIVGFGSIKLIPSEELLADRKEIFYRDVSVGNTAGGSNRIDPNEAWIKALQGIREDTEKSYNKLWR